MGIEYTGNEIERLEKLVFNTQIIQNFSPIEKLYLINPLLNKFRRILKCYYCS